MSVQPATALDVDQDWWRGAVIYQIYPRSFADSNGDGVGDLAGITRRLDYVASLGVDAIWLSPFYTSPMRDFGYDVADYCAVDPMFGSLADFDALVAKAHALGLRVIVDQVYSHTSDEHAWFKESRASRDNPKADWYVWADPRPDGSPPNNWQSVFTGAAWTWDARRRQYYLHNFLSSQPDLNVHNRAVQDALLDVARFWLNRGVDGFRIDALNFAMHDLELRDNPAKIGAVGKRPFDFQHHYFNQSHPDIVGFIERLRALFDAYPGRFAVAEVGGERALEESRLYTEGDRRLHTAYSFVFLYADAITPALVREAIEAWPDAPGAGWPAWTFSNHDAPRVASRWGKDQGPHCTRALLALLMTIRGNAFLYYGEELGLPQAHVAYEDLKDPEAISNWPETLGRDGARTPMPWESLGPSAGFSETARGWLPVDPAHVPLAVSRQTNDPHSALSWTRELLAWRRSRAEIVRGSIRFVDAPDPVLLFEREHEGVRAVCAFNLSAAPAVVDLGAYEGFEPAPLFGRERPSAHFELGAWDCRVFTSGE